MQLSCPAHSSTPVASCKRKKLFHPPVLLRIPCKINAYIIVSLFVLPVWRDQSTFWSSAQGPGEVAEQPAALQTVRVRATSPGPSCVRQWRTVLGFACNFPGNIIFESWWEVIYWLWRTFMCSVFGTELRSIKHDCCILMFCSCFWRESAFTKSAQVICATVLLQVCQLQVGQYLNSVNNLF